MTTYSYSVASGVGIYAGRQNPVPAWLRVAGLHEWVEIEGTESAGGALIDAYSGFALTPGGVIVIAGAGGHGTGSADNRVVSLGLMVDSPEWTQRVAPSASNATLGQAYNSDGLPKAAHRYANIHHIAALDQVLLFGGRYDISNDTHNKTDAVEMAPWRWRGVVPGSPGTSGSGLADPSPSGYLPVAVDANGHLWCILHSNGTVAKYDPVADTWSQPAMAATVSPNVRSPWALDTTRGVLFGLCWADGEGSGIGMRAVVMDGSTQTAISFNASAAYTQWLADTPEYAGMDYDPENDRFLFYDGRSTRAGRVYAITPNGGTTWDMSILSIAGSPPGATGANGVHSRWRYVPALKGFVLLPEAASNLFFVRVA